MHVDSFDWIESSESSVPAIIIVPIITEILRLTNIISYFHNVHVLRIENMLICCKYVEYVFLCDIFVFMSLKDVFFFCFYSYCRKIRLSNAWVYANIKNEIPDLGGKH